MQRQTSIRSFFLKPSPENQNPGTKTSGAVLLDEKVAQFPWKQQSHSLPAGKQSTMRNNTCVEIRGTDTPPEKVPRPILSTSFAGADGHKPSPFFSIMHKFAKVDDREDSSLRSQGNGGFSNTCFISSNISQPKRLSGEGTASQHPDTNKVSGRNGTVDQGSILLIDSDDAVPGPETPGMKPLVSRLKRTQDDHCTLKDTDDHSLVDTCKRAKLLLELRAGSEKYGATADTSITSKFEWLDPSRLRDANGRRPGDALYDKRTLYIPPETMKKMSASQKQYWSVKCQYMDVMLFFKVGKFYELYEIDAEIGHKELDWKMTFSGVGKCRQVGISESGIDDAVQKLIARGYKVGRIEQLETSDQAKARGANSVIQRKLVNVVTPSTTVNNIGPDAVHVLALKELSCDLENGSNIYGFAFVDCAALKFWVGSIRDDASFAGLGALLMQVTPKEIVYEIQGMSKEAQKAIRNHSLSGSTSLQLSPVQTSTDFIDASEVRNLIKSKGYFKGSDFFEYAPDSIMHHDIAFSALGGLIGHLSRLMLDDILRNADIVPYQVYSGCLRMDGQTLMNLEIFNNSADGGYSGTMYKYLNNCITPSGKRLLRNWICHPLRDVDEINHRLNVVENLVANSEVVLLVAQYLRKLPDLERLLGRIKACAQPSASLIMPLIGKKILKQQVKVFGSLVKGLQIGMDLMILLQKEGHINTSLSRILNLPVLDGKDGLYTFLSKFEAAVESDFPNYQDHDVTDPDAEILSILIELFVEKAKQFSQVIHAIKCLDVLRSFAVIANSSCGAMSRPVILSHPKFSNISEEKRGPVLNIKGLWHPFALAENGRSPVPNDINLGQGTDAYHPRTLLLTGPNMGGKSTLLRATCLAVILAQMGSYVPCETCVLSPADTIFTRLGATDRIMTGESTFFIECTETASVLQNATQDSLVLLDELGRGTSTFDGYAIAYAVFRYLVEKVNCRLLFATHYHPLTKEFASHPHVLLQHMACTFNSKSQTSIEDDQELIFLYRLTPGACPESYGLQVARMAGIPKQVVESASKAGHSMKESIGESFRSSEQRSEFSTLHEGWLRTLVTITKTEEHDSYDEDAFDTLFCVWHELKSLYQSSMVNA